MTKALIDQNYVKSKLGVLFSDGVTLVPIKINSLNGAVQVNAIDTVAPAILTLYTNGMAIPRDSNNQPALCGQSDTNSEVVYPVFVDAAGAILINT